MIRSLHLTNVGPAEQLSFDFASRLNVLTGDNGLGKSFVLDVLWWLLTTTWAGEPAIPHDTTDEQSNAHSKKSKAKKTPKGPNSEDGTPVSYETTSPQISGALGWRTGGFSDGHELVLGGHYDRQTQSWERDPWFVDTLTDGKGVHENDIVAESAIPESLVVFFRIDGSVTVWDSYQIAPVPISATSPGVSPSAPDHPFRLGFSERLSRATVSLSATEVWDGREVVNNGHDRRRTVCRGLIEDWVTWQGTKSNEFALLQKVLHDLSEPEEPLLPGPAMRVRLDDRRDIPTLETAYGRVPVTLASAGVKRILTLAYVLIWAWTEHQKAAKLIRRQPCRDMIVLMDEVELHLHPRWQRVLLPALLRAIGSYAPNVATQLFVTTHSPLVLASLEPTFNPAMDQLFSFSLSKKRTGQRVRVEKMPWRIIGDAALWLTSPVFGLKYATSPDAEVALLKATKALDKTDITPAQLKKIHDDLRGVLRDTDPFWGRWMMLAKKLGIEP